MKGFRGYVSRAQEGILSPNPSAEEYDRVPGPEAVRERASRPVLDRDDWDRPADRAVRTDPAAPADSTAPADPAATDPLADSEDNREQTASGTGPLDADQPDSEQDDRSQVDRSSADTGRAPAASLHLAAAAGQDAQKESLWRRFFTPRVLLAALCINLLLGGLLAVIMYLDRPAQPVYVYYIDLADRPPEAAVAPDAANAGNQPDNPEQPDQTEESDRHGRPDQPEAAAPADQAGQPEKNKPDAAPGRETGPAGEGLQP